MYANFVGIVGIADISVAYLFLYPSKAGLHFVLLFLYASKAGISEAYSNKAGIQKELLFIFKLL